MCFDFTVLVLTGLKLALPKKRSEHSKLVKLIFGDGLIFFIIAFLSNLVATVGCPNYAFRHGRCLRYRADQIFMLLNLNAVMSIIANVPAAICSTVCPLLVHVRLLSLIISIFLQIVACRAVRRLTNYTSQGAEVFA